ncbi:MAG: hypothetical protein QOH81_1716 [Sphingomonadales bacterium]|jgi:hypothetical protein|nr:hypothetical protein [Sphingomonadales bacterium]
MARTPRNGNRGQERVFLAIVDSLRRNPPYLLIFGVIFLTYLVCVALIATGSEQPGYRAEMGLAVLFLETIVAVAVIRIVEAQSSRIERIETLEAALTERERKMAELSKALAEADKVDINIDHHELKSCLLATVDNIRRALLYINPSFHDEMIYEVAGFQKASGRWAIGTLQTDSANYERILRHFYRNARRSIFATSNQEYMEFWAQVQSSGSIIKAHREAFQKNQAVVTRVFMFSTVNQIAAEHLAIMRNHSREAFITAKVFIADENEAFAANLIKDFVIVDRGLPSQAIGITSSFEPGAMGARWVFDADADVERAAEFIDGSSVSLDELEERLA